MTDLQTADTRARPPAVPGRSPDNDLILPLVGWGTYLVGWGLIGLVIAYVDRKNAPPSVQTNYTYMIRTFWIGCAYLVLGLLLSGLFFLLSGIIHGAGLVLAAIALWGLPLLTAVWFIARCVKGIVLVTRRQDVDNPGSWLV